VATIIPALTSRATPGERRFARRLEALLEDDDLCWHDVALGRRHQHPDFIILHPRRGLLVVEVKDWKLDSIRSATRDTIGLLTPSGLKHVGHPLEQARQYAFLIKELLERDPALLVPAGQPHQGRLLFPYAYGVALANITRKQFDGTNLAAVIQPHLVICRDEMASNVEAEAFQTRLWEMFTVRFGGVLTMPQIDRIRGHLYPEIRISQAGLFGQSPPKAEAQAPIAEDSLMRVMDLHQEQLARSLGDGHRVIHGVAGSGKTLILGYQCERLAQTLGKPVLVLCYNVALAAKLEHIVAERGLTDRVTVRSFHRWCLDQLQLYHVAKPPQGEIFYDALVTTVINAVEAGQIPRAQYGAVLIDEGHDFAPEWLQLVTQMVDPETNSLLLLYDDAQAIYTNKRPIKFSFKSVGIQAQGRTTILRINYRNTNEILRCAYALARDVLTPEDAEEDGVPLVLPKMAGRHGPAPVLIRSRSLEAEAGDIAAQLLEIHSSGIPWKDMAVLYHAHFVGDKVAGALREVSIPFERLQKSGGSRKYDATADSVKLMTMHSSKGLEFPVVAIAGIGFLPVHADQAASDAKLLYVGMTRTTERLVMTASRESDFVTRLARWEATRDRGLPN
jgi:hypothetical protein